MRHWAPARQNGTAETRPVAPAPAALPSSVAPRGGKTALWGMVLAWIAVLIYASANPIVVRLTEIGWHYPTEQGRNAITYTNLYFLGTLISIVPLSLMFRRDLKVDVIRQVSRKDWGILTLSALLSSALTPALFFTALTHTSVTNIALISRIEPPLFLLGALFILGERFETRTLMAALLALTGAIVIIAAQDAGSWTGIRLGELAAVAATLSYVASTLVSRFGLKRVPVGLFSIYRSGAGALIYFTGMSVFYGIETFRDLFEPVLWQWVWVYTGVVLIAGQVAWAIALKHTSSKTLSLAASFAPLAGVMLAMVMLDENPGPGLLPGSVMILMSIAWAHGALDWIRDSCRFKQALWGVSAFGLWMPVKGLAPFPRCGPPNISRAEFKPPSPRPS